MDWASPEMWRMVGEACLVGFFCGFALMVLGGMVMGLWVRIRISLDRDKPQSVTEEQNRREAVH